MESQLKNLLRFSQQKNFETSKGAIFSAALAILPFSKLPAASRQPLLRTFLVSTNLSRFGFQIFVDVSQLLMDPAAYVHTDWGLPLAEYAVRRK